MTLTTFVGGTNALASEVNDNFTELETSITNNFNTHEADIADLYDGVVWKHLQTLSPSGSTTVSTSALTAYDEYMAIVKVYQSGGSSTSIISLRINSDSGATYSYLGIDGAPAAINDNTDETSIRLGAVVHSTTTCRSAIQITLPGKTAPASSGRLAVNISGGGTAPSSTAGIYFHGTWAGGNNTQVTSLTFLGSQPITGVIEVFGRNNL